jgi:hypothetical protein
MTYRGHIRNGVAVLDERVALPDGTPVRVEVDGLPGDFWANKSIEDLAREQGVKPIQSVGELAGEWPPEETVDEFLAFIREARR